MLALRYVIVLSIVSRVCCQISPKIVYGNDAKIWMYPHAAWIEISGLYICGASLLNQRIALTAAHCLKECGNDRPVILNAGSTSRHRGFTSRTVDKCLMHWKYLSSSTADNNDIGLVRARTPFTFSSTIKRLAIMRNPPVTKQARLAGWGFIHVKSKTLADDLQRINQTLWSKAKCEKAIGKIPPDCFCAANKNPTRHAAGGDSGSALVIKYYIGIGLVAFSIAHSKHIIVYTNISYHYEWIKVNAKNMYCVR